MKKWMILFLICVLCAGMLTACTVAPEVAAPEATPAAAEETKAPQTVQTAEAADGMDMLGVTAIVSNTDGVVVIKAVKTKLTITTATESEPETYTREEGDTVELTLKKDAVIDFPMVDDLVNTVTITGEEFDGEFRALIEQLGSETPILFTYEMEGDQVSKMQYVYLP